MNSCENNNERGQFSEMRNTDTGLSDSRKHMRFAEINEVSGFFTAPGEKRLCI